MDWYSDKFVARRKGSKETDPMLGLLGLAKEIWVGEDPDDYVSRVRERWKCSRIFRDTNLFIYVIEEFGESVGAGE